MGVFYPVTDIWRLGWVKIVNPENRSQTGWLSPEYRSANQHFPTTLIRQDNTELGKEMMLITKITPIRI